MFGPQFSILALGHNQQCSKSYLPSNKIIEPCRTATCCIIHAKYNAILCSLTGGGRKNGSFTASEIEVFLKNYNINHCCVNVQILRL